VTDDGESEYEEVEEGDEAGGAGGADADAVANPGDGATSPRRGKVGKPQKVTAVVIEVRRRSRQVQL
jgi:hypothetical protein